MILNQVEELPARAGELPAEAEQAVGRLLNVVEALSADKRELAKEVERLRQRLERKKKPKTTGGASQDDNQTAKSDSDYSSKKRWQRDKKASNTRDRRLFKDLTIHQEIECPIDPATLSSDAVRVEDESVVVQDIEIKPHNIRFQRHVYYSAAAGKFFRGPLPNGYDVGDFGVDLRALVLSLKYCSNMSEPNIRAFLENFDVQISRGSLSNILTNTAASFEQAYHDVLIAGLSSTPYQQTDDISARVAGQPWHTHVFCNPFYTWYSTRSGKDRLTVLAVLQNQDAARLRFNEQTLALLRDEFAIPGTWNRSLAAWIDEQGGHVEFDAESLKALFDDWFDGRCQQTRTAIEQAAA